MKSLHPVRHLSLHLSLGSWEPALTTGNQQGRFFLITGEVEAFYSSAKKDKGRKHFNVVILKGRAGGERSECH